MACEDCRRARSAGLCEACDHRRQAEALIVEAGLLAATWSADPSDPVAVAAVAAEVRTAIGDAIAADWAEFQQITDPADMTAAGPDAVEDAAQRAATEAAAKAQNRTAEHRLVVRLEQLHAQARPEPVRPAPWSRRLPELAARPLDGEALGVIA
ncbi:hypothetical protein ACFVP0_21600 [Streptomyces cinereoruber]|uniref:hypothetical protein n=1 Tax=Streptomyces cinereoruber TaxID=67260 RepID=UPI0036BFE756